MGYMADDETKSITQDFMVFVGPTVIETEEQALAVYYQMQSYPELRVLLAQHQREIARAIQQKDTQTLIGVVQKVQSDFLRGLSEKAYQVQVDTERKIAEARMDPDKIASRVNSAEQALSETLETTKALYSAKKLQNRAFIEELVKNYSRLPETESRSLTDTIIANAETRADFSPEEIIQRAAKTIRGSQDFINKLQHNREVIERVADVQKNNVATIEQQVIGAVLDSPEPTTTIRALNRYAEIGETKPIEIDGLIKKAKFVSIASSIVRQVPENSVPDYNGFFTALALTGNPIEKALAPFADAVLTIFPSDTKETIITGVMSSLWKKDTKPGGIVQNALGNLFGSDMITKAIQQGNAVFSTTSKGGVLSPAQAFLGDVVTTVFRPKITTVWVEMVRTNTMALPTSSYQYYLSLFAQLGSEKAAKTVATKLGKRVVLKVGEKVATTTLGKSLGAFLGSFLGPGPGTFLGWLVGDIVIDQGLKLVGRAVSGFFNLLSFKFLTDLMSGDAPTTPLWEQEGAKWLLIGAGVLLFIVLFPISLFGLTGANYQQLVGDNAFVQGLGTGNEYQYADCENNPTDPLCSMTPCDPSAQDCRWPTSGTITQGPFTSCGGTHAHANAIDIGASNGTDVYATIHGRVEAVFTGCPDYNGYLGNICGGYLGNHIIIKGTPPYNYTLKFGHLLSSSVRVSVGEEVFPTTPIGEMDNSGSSSGPHLHFSFIDNSGQNRSINSILPFAIDHCVNSEPGCTACNYPAVGGGSQ